MIAEAAYFKAQKRGFDPAYDQQNWEEACKEIDELLAKRGQG